jgi:hypothetical protein
VAGPLKPVAGSPRAPAGGAPEPAADAEPEAKAPEPEKGWRKKRALASTVKSEVKDLGARGLGPLRDKAEQLKRMGGAALTREFLEQRDLLEAARRQGDSAKARALDGALRLFSEVMKERGVLAPAIGATAAQMRFPAARFQKNLLDLSPVRLQQELLQKARAYREAVGAGKGGTLAAQALGKEVAELRAEADRRDPAQLREAVRDAVGDPGAGAHVGTADDPAVIAKDDTTNLIAERDLAMPAEAGAFYLMSTTGGLYGASGKPSPADVHQGQIGDCYFLSSLASLAAMRPDLIQDAIHYRGTTDESEAGKTVHVSHYDVTLYKRVPDPKGGYALVKKTVQVNDKLPVSKNVWDGQQYKMVLVDSPRGANWVALMEKAFAATNPQGYAGIGQGGVPSEGMEALTGVKCPPRVDTQKLDETHAWNNPPADALFAAIQKAVAAGHLTCTNTYVNDPPDTNAYPLYIGNVLDRLNTKSPRKPIDVNAGYHRGWKYDDSSAAGKDGLVQGHAYSILGARTDASGKKFITLRNPWGQTVPKQWQDGDHDDGTFDMPLDDFVVLFSAFYESGALPPPKA